MIDSEEEWYGFWTGREPSGSLYISYESAIGDPEEGWHRFEVEAVLPGFQARFSFESQIAKFKVFSDEVRAMYDTLAGNACFKPTQSNVFIEGTVNKLGHVRWEITLRSDLGDSPELKFRIAEDQTQLWNVHAQIEYLLEFIAQINPSR